MTRQRGPGFGRASAELFNVVIAFTCDINLIIIIRGYYATSGPTKTRDNKEKGFPNKASLKHIQSVLQFTPKRNNF